MSLIDKTALPQVAMEFMNEVHAEDVDIINALYDLVLTYEEQPNEENAARVDRQYQRWFEHTVAHFQGEEEEMQEYCFPPYPIHKGEHDHALRTMDEVFRSWSASRDITVVKSYMTQQLVPWLVNHIQTMDTVTASFLSGGMSGCSMH